MARTLIDLTSAEQVQGVLPAANGGTGLSSTGASGNVPTSNGSGAWVSSPQTSTTQRTFAFFGG
jgi:hypothetical protein